MNRKHPLDEERLQAYVDDRLDAAARAEVEAQLDADPELAARAAAYRRQHKTLHETFDAVLDEPLPARLRRPQSARRSPLLARAAAVLWMMLGGGVGWFGATTLQQGGARLAAAPPMLPREAAMAYAVYSPEVMHPVEVGAAQEPHLLGWLSKRLGHRLRAPDLAQYGYRLMGGRLLPANAGPAAQFMYENNAGERLTLYVTVPRHAGSDTAFRYAEEHGVSVFYWVDRDLGYALSAKLGRKQLLRIADGVYRQITL